MLTPLPAKIEGHIFRTIHRRQPAPITRNAKLVRQPRRPILSDHIQPKTHQTALIVTVQHLESNNPVTPTILLAGQQSRTKRITTHKNTQRHQPDSGSAVAKTDRPTPDTLATL